MRRMGVVLSGLLSASMAWSMTEAGLQSDVVSSLGEARKIVVNLAELQGLLGSRVSVDPVISSGWTQLSGSWKVPSSVSDQQVTSVVCTTELVDPSDPLLQQYGYVRVGQVVPSYSGQQSDFYREVAVQRAYVSTMISFSVQSRQRYFYRKDYSGRQGSFNLPPVAGVDAGCTAFSSGSYFFLLGDMGDALCGGCPCPFEDSMVSVNMIQTQGNDLSTVPGVLEANGGGKKKAEVAVAGVVRPTVIAKKVIMRGMKLLKKRVRPAVVVVMGIRSLLSVTTSVRFQMAVRRRTTKGNGLRY